MREIEVEITLMGGERRICSLPENSEPLHELHAALMAAQQPDNPQQGALLQIPLDGGEAAFTFAADSLISLVTRPPVVLDQTPTTPSLIHQQQTQFAPFVTIDDFLTPDENAELLEYAEANEAHFEGSTVINKSKSATDDDVRKSRVLFAIRDTKWRDIFLNRVKLHLCHIAPTLGIADQRFDQDEIQLTSSNDGDFFKRHADADRNEKQVAGRTITFVYYFHRTPKPYTGGDLLFYAANPEDPAHARGSFVTAVAPRNNCLVAFASHTWHEVDLVKCPSGAFGDSRFTVNGWLRRQVS